MRIALVHENTEGLRHDVRVVLNALNLLTQSALELIEVCLDWSEGHHLAEAADPIISGIQSIDVVIFFEMANNHPVFMQATRKIMIPNPEYLEPRYIEIAQRCDTVWHKTKFSKTVIKPVLPMCRHKLIGFTSEVLLTSAAINNDRFLHVKGTAATRRSTEVILRYWLRKPSLPRLTIVCNRHFPGLPKALPSNVKIIEGWLDREKFLRIYCDHGIHLCTSQHEGFGHYINESRCFGALVITTDAPPMNELISSRSGILVAAAVSSSLNRGVTYSITEAALSRAVTKALKLKTAERARMMALAQCFYWRDRNRFYRRLFNELSEWLG